MPIPTQPVLLQYQYYVIYTLLGSLSFSLTPHIHLTILISVTAGLTDRLTAFDPGQPG